MGKGCKCLDYSISSHPALEVCHNDRVVAYKSAENCFEMVSNLWSSWQIVLFCVTKTYI